MSITLAELKRKIIKELRVYSNAGVVTAANDNLDYSLSFNDFADTAQKQVAEYAKIHANYAFSQYPIDPINGRFYGFNQVLFIPGNSDLTDIQGVKGQAFYTEVNKPCNIYFEESSNNGLTWSNIPTVSWTGTTTDTSNPLVITNITSYTAFKGLITPTLSTNIVRLRFTGLYPFQRQNTALWNVTFASVNDVPIYRPRIKRDLPSDFMSFNKLINETDDRVYQQMIDFTFENRRTLVMNYFYTGSFNVNYYKYPLKIWDSLNSSTVTTETGTALGGTTSTIQLPSTSSSIDKYYNGQTITITAGTGINQKGICADYDGKSKVLTIQTPFNVAVDNTSQYIIQQYTDDIYVMEVYDEAVEAIPFFIGAMVFADEDRAMSQKLMDIYNSRLANLTTKEQTSVVQVISTSGW